MIPNIILCPFLTSISNVVLFKLEDGRLVISGFGIVRELSDPASNYNMTYLLRLLTEFACIVIHTKHSEKDGVHGDIGADIELTIFIREPVLRVHGEGLVRYTSHKCKMKVPTHSEMEVLLVLRSRFSPS